MVVDKVCLHLKLDDLGRPEWLEGFDPKLVFGKLETALFASGADQVSIDSHVYKKVLDNAGKLLEKDRWGNIVKGGGWSPYRFLIYELIQG